MTWRMSIKTFIYQANKEGIYDAIQMSKIIVSLSWCFLFQILCQAREDAAICILFLFPNSALICALHKSKLRDWLINWADFVRTYL